MTKKPPTTSPADYIVPLEMNGLQGRMLRLPAPKHKKREILFIYGHHSSLERWMGLAEVFNDFGAVTMPDLPGFGGMESFYKIKEKPTIDNYADYLAAFVKLRYKRTKVSIVALSFGFTIVTRMLQRYPDLTKRVDLLVSAVGFAHYQDFAFTKTRYWGYRLLADFFKHRLPAAFFKGVVLHPIVLRLAYHRMHNAKEKFKSVDRARMKEVMNFEIYLWHANDVRTWLYTSAEMFRLDNCTKQIKLPLWHIKVKNDRYFDNQLVEQHFRVIFTDVQIDESVSASHAPSILSDKREAAVIVPKRIRRALNRQ